MQYEAVAEAYRDLEQATARLALIDRLATLLAQTPAELLGTVCYLCQGLVAPEFAGVDLGLAEKLAVRAVGTATGTSPEQVLVRLRETGDLGQAAELLLAATAGDRPAGLSVTVVVDTLHQIARAEGHGSQGRKLNLLVGLLAEATPVEARYLLRLVTGALRLGVGTPTILDALAQVYAGGRAARPVLERAYNICCDLGSVASALAGGGVAAVTDGCEGLLCKSLSPTAGYQAGARGWLWIKLKRDYRTELSDTVDLVVVGAFAGRGRRRGVYGALLLAAYDPAADVFRTVCKCGTGFSDAELAALPARLAPLARPTQPARVDTRQPADMWFEPGLVLEVLSAELTLSPNHTAGWGQVKEHSGLAMRFPRFTGRWRDDKGPQDATTTQELVDLYRTARRAPTRA